MLSNNGKIYEVYFYLKSRIEHHISNSEENYPSPNQDNLSSMTASYYYFDLLKLCLVYAVCMCAYFGLVWDELWFKLHANAEKVVINTKNEWVTFQ